MAKPKYADVLGDLQPAPVADKPRQEKIDGIKGRLAGEQTLEVVEMYLAARQEKRRVEALLYDVNLQIEALTQMLCDSQERHDPDWGKYGANERSIRLPTGETIRVEREPYGVVKNKEAFRLWCVANGYETKMQLWPTTMNAIVKERLVAGEALPDGTEAYPSASVVLVGAKQEGGE